VTPLEGALWLAARSFYVFPCDHPELEQCAGLHRACDGGRGKHPCVPFTRQHTTDPADVHRMFQQPRNIGVAVGACTRGDEQLLVVDSDRPGAIEDAAAAFGHRHEPTMRVHTAKGHHDYYWVPASLHLGNGLGQLRGKFDGDVRSGNAYVIGPGSVHATGVVYTLDDPEQPPRAAPAWLLKALQNVPRPTELLRREALPGGRRAYDDLLGLVSFVLDSQAGDRNNRLYWAACRAFEHAAAGRVDKASVATALCDAATRVGLPDVEARAAIRSAYRTGGAR
jgi:hypothetical protein